MWSVGLFLRVSVRQDCACLHREREQFEYTLIHAVIYHPSVFLIKTTQQKKSSKRSPGASERMCTVPADGRIMLLYFTSWFHPNILSVFTQIQSFKNQQRRVKIISQSPTRVSRVDVRSLQFCCCFFSQVSVRQLLVRWLYTVFERLADGVPFN